MLHQVESAFHPHDASSSPLYVSTAHFQDYMFVPVATTIVYISLIAYGHTYMKNRDAWNLNSQLVAWNAFLALFSMIGAYRTAPTLLFKLSSSNFADTICSPPAKDWGAGPCGLWVQLFVVSKFIELLDTAFIVLRKRKLLFLHWYHHMTVLLYCWHAYATEAPHALYFVAMNYCVHSIMYLYYALMAARVKRIPFPPEIITSAQIAQMVVGVLVQFAAMRLKSPTCNVNSANLLFGGIMYLSYLALFVQFALNRFVFNKYKRGKIMTEVAGHGEPPSIRTSFPVTTAILDKFATRIKRTISFTITV